MALQEISLPRLDTYTKLVGVDDVATTQFAIWWDQVAGQLEAGINGVIAAQNAAEAAQASANTAQTTADGAQTSADTAQTTANGAQTSADTAQTRADDAYALADTKVTKDQTAAPAYGTYSGQTISNPPTQAEVQTTDDAVKAASAALHSVITKLQAVDVFT